MAICHYCHQEMLTAESCTDALIVIRGREYHPIRYGHEPGWRRGPRRCGDCNVVKGQIHHHGCDVERCPACGRQSIMCGCLWAGEEHLDEYWVEEMEERFLLVGPDEA